MKKGLLFILWCCATGAIAQKQLLNGGFENWKDTAGGMIPLHWSVEMVAALRHSPSASAREGEKALILSTWYSYVEGHLFYGDHPKPDHEKWTDYTVPFKGKPRKLSGWFRYTHPINPGDSAGCRVLIKDRNDDTLAYGHHLFPVTQHWTVFELPLMYFSSKPANKIAIYFTSAEGGGGMNDDSYPNRLYLDGLKFVYRKE